MIPEGMKKRGVLLTLPWDAAHTLVDKGLGDFDCLGDEEYGIGVAVPGDRIASYTPGDEPEIVLSPGGFVVVRGEPDMLVGRSWMREQSVSGLFEALPPENLNEMWKDGVP
jgi:hypothetical protein